MFRPHSGRPKTFDHPQNRAARSLLIQYIHYSEDQQKTAAQAERALCTLCAKNDQIEFQAAQKIDN
ncbi:MAG: hypothetical protein S4CHLAM123_00520 [Chlamydiales bacterium]|nr:hypothetical protein [Chlamydiales bacterium]